MSCSESIRACERPTWTRWKHCGSNNFRLFRLYFFQVRQLQSSGIRQNPIAARDRSDTYPARHIELNSCQLIIGFISAQFRQSIILSHLGLITAWLNPVLLLHAFKRRIQRAWPQRECASTHLLNFLHDSVAMQGFDQSKRYVAVGFCQARSAGVVGPDCLWAFRRRKNNSIATSRTAAAVNRTAAAAGRSAAADIRSRFNGDDPYSGLHIRI